MVGERAQLKGDDESHDQRGIARASDGPATTSNEGSSDSRVVVVCRQ